jgi:hypothetical protein
MVERSTVAQVAGDEVEIDMLDLLALAEIDHIESRTDGFVGRVVDQDHCASDGSGREQVVDISAHSLGRVISVHKREVDVATSIRERGETLWQQRVAIARVQYHVREVVDWQRGLNEIEGMDLAAMRGDTPQRTTLSRADLDCELRLELGQDSIERRPLAEGHLARTCREQVDHWNKTIRLSIARGVERTRRWISDDGVPVRMSRLCDDGR